VLGTVSTISEDARRSTCATSPCQQIRLPNTAERIAVISGCERDYESSCRAFAHSSSSQRKGRRLTRIAAVSPILPMRSSKTN